MNSSKYYIVYQRCQGIFCFVLFCFVFFGFFSYKSYRKRWVCWPGTYIHVTSNVQNKYEKGQAFLKDITSKGY